MIFSGTSNAADGSHVDVFLEGVHLIDTAGNTAVSSAVQSLVIDTTRPDLTISATQSGTITGPATYNFAFTEAVTGFTLSDISASNATLSAFTRIDATHYSVVATPTGSGAGSLSLSVASGAYSDNAGNSNSASDSISQNYHLGPPETINLGSLGQLINPYQVAGTNTVYYYLDTNKDGAIAQGDIFPHQYADTDRLNHTQLDAVFAPGSMTVDGTYSAVVNGVTVSLHGFSDQEFRDAFAANQLWTGTANDADEVWSSTRILLPGGTFPGAGPGGTDLVTQDSYGHSTVSSFGSVVHSDSGGGGDDVWVHHVMLSVVI